MTLTSHTDFCRFSGDGTAMPWGGTVLYPGRRQAESEIHPVQISVRRVSRNEELLRKGKIVCQFPQDEEKLTHTLSASI